MFGSLINNDEITKLFKINNNINSKICCKMAKHDENKDLCLVSRVAKIDYSNKTIQAPKTAVIGIRTWGRIDFLVNYCGWFFSWNNAVSVSRRVVESDNKDKIRKQNERKQSKERALTNKKKR